MNEIIGSKHGDLTILDVVGRTPNRGKLVLCLCSCGNTTTVAFNSLKSGHTKSCGCLQRKSVSTHKKSRSRLYKVWMDMRSRCGWKNGQDYKRYGQRGITVCDEWLNNFQAFNEWAISSGYDETAPKGKCTLDRIDVNKGYSPENCRWVDAKTQANNRRDNKFITYNGETHTITEWAELCGINVRTLRSRLYRHRWSIEQALTLPPLPKGVHLR